ncbi:exodeoxyribonuclease III [Empedobacter stercoris]|uniref:Exodeoxyribonuclease III n=2 Tax=Empedobacter TaxID=59734 RepID=A0ABY8V6K8_9FLAO|nr:MULTISPECIES: exodeoxyribonuclease III [Empedobacter]MCA4777278.1 exodeoxyribonuclease III [Empedobacter stercoris]MDM1523419.1 exodeoxyribonuclease III [Empedobacter sp. 225-1]MDM1543465.1 exodeoxyribonuclease III [Empedobacter sp. 189-2]NOJ74544.1 exodeoxyribonuclease III [Empedobacter stercoris]UWX66607.1 exodeoxyribonuclease III [Empedobacter stercoris]
MKIISYNVNGIRAAITKGLVDWLEAAQPDVFCIQETKAMQEQVDTKPFEDLGYHIYWHAAEKKGYSGVAIFSKIKPNHVQIGTGIDYIDREGRVLRLDFDNVSVISLYLPSGTNIDRLDFKLQFCDDFKDYIKELKISHPNLVICGDYNICHEAIDIHDPVRNAKVSGFLPIEREWMSAFIDECNMIDSFRYFVKEPHHYSWWSYRANSRNNNKGWRIDYNMVSTTLEEKMTRATILPDAKHSDHCPVLLELDV